MGCFPLELLLLIEILFRKALVSKPRFLQARYLDHFQEFCGRLDEICGVVLKWFLHIMSVLAIKGSWDTNP